MLSQCTRRFPSDVSPGDAGLKRMREPMVQRSKACEDRLTPAGALRRPRDKRVEPRYISRLHGGHLSDGGRGFICACVVRDHSKTGARLLVPPDVSLPKRLWFYDDDIKQAVRVEIRWHRGQEVGIMKLT